MKVRLPSLAKGLGLAAVLLGGALAVLPAHVGAQAPQNGNLIPVGSSAFGSGLVTLNGYNGVAVTLNGGAFGATYNVYSCSAAVSTPAGAGCQLDGAVFVNGGGQATGSLSSPVPAASTAEVFVQNAGNPNELYAAVFVGGYVPCASGTSVTYVLGQPTCTPSVASGVACNYLNIYTNLPVCVPIGGGVALPFYGLNLLQFNTSCIPGFGLQPVLVNGVVIWQFC